MSRLRTCRLLAAAVCLWSLTGVAVADTTEATTEPAPEPTAESPLEEAPRDEVAAASNAAVYQLGDGSTEVTANGSWVSLRRCSIGVPPSYYERRPCDGPDGWAYVTGSVDTPGVHYGLLGTGLLGSVDDLVLSALDERLFVASVASSSQDPSSAPEAWLIDSVTGHRGLLTWQEEPTTLNTPERVLVLFPAPKPIPPGGTRFLPRVVDRRDWTVRPLRVPEDATAALAIHQPGSGRIWIGTAPEGGHVGLAYTDDGGASWTDVELPSSLRPTSAELVASEAAPGSEQLLVVAATGQHVAVTNAWGGASDVFVSADAGETWHTVVLDPADGNGRRLYVLADGRLMVVLSFDVFTIGVLVSSSPSDWSQLDASAFGFDPGVLAQVHSSVDVSQQGLVVHHERDSCDNAQLGMPLRFSTDLTDWWMIPGLEYEPLTRC
jgi:hypothetical protein